MIKPNQKNTLIKKLLGTILVIPILISGCENKEPEEVSAQATKPQAIPVKLATLRSSTLVDSSEYVGTLEAQERVNLAPRIDGRIINIFVLEGERVIAGSPIVQLEPTQEKEDVIAADRNVDIERGRLTEVEAQVRTAEAERAQAAADVAAVKADLLDIEAQLKLARINVKRSKMLVEGGALARQDLDDKTTDLETLQAQLKAQQETLNASRKALEAAERRVEQARSNIDIQKSAIAKAQAELGSVSQNLAFNTINAPITGIIGSFEEKKVGDYVSVGDTITTITNNEQLQLNVSIPIEYRSRLQRGLPVEVLNEDDSIGARGSIVYIAPSVNQETQSVLTKIAFGRGNNLRNNEYIRVRVIWDEAPGLLVPTTAISRLGGQRFVFVAKQEEDGDLVARQVPIKVGDIQGQNYQVISGLRPGDKIAVNRILDLKDGTPISEEEVTSSSNE